MMSNILIVIVVVSTCSLLPVHSQNVTEYPSTNIFEDAAFQILSTVILNKANSEALKYLDELKNTQCKHDLQVVYNGAINKEKWALEMADAWAKPQTGLLTGNLMHLGNFDECLSISHKIGKTDNGNGTVIDGQYCAAVFEPKKREIIQLLINVMLGESFNNSKQYGELVYFVEGLKLSWGICIPKSCTPEILTDVWNYTKHKYSFDFNLHFNDFLCHYRGKLTLSTSAIVAIVVFSAVFLFVAVATTYDFATYKRKDKNKILMAFSGYANGAKLLSTSKTDDQMCCLNGLRVISMFWIIVAHRALIFYYTPHLNSFVIREWKQEIQNMVILAATFGVDTFFVVSGLLVSYFFFQTRAKGIKINIFMYYLHRYLRLTPALAAVVLFFATLIEYVGDGPFWPLIYPLFQRDCETNWWATLLYIQNYAYPNSHCASQAWYLAVDTQLYFMAPLLLFPLAKWPKKTMSVIIILTLGSMAAAFSQSWIFQLGSVYFDETSTFHRNYIATHIRASTWLIGFILGYLMFKLKNKKIILNKRFVILSWTLSLAALCAIVFGHVSFTRNKYNIVKSSIFNTLARPSWSLAICWIIFGCTRGYGGFINSFLSLPIFNILIKINYSIYLLHILPLVFYICRGRVTTYFNSAEQLHLVWSDIIATIFLAFIWTLVFESPIVALEKIIFKRGADSKPPDQIFNHYKHNDNNSTPTIISITMLKDK